MKKIYITFSLIILAGFSFAQSFQLSNPDTTITNTVDSILFAPVNITNTSATAKDVIVERVELSIVSGTDNLFCWAICYSPPVSISPDHITINPGQTITDFYAKYYPNGLGGISNIKYRFYDKNNPVDSVVFMVTYNATPVGLKENKLNNAPFKIQPNPAFNVANLKYFVTAPGSYLIITDILGKEIKSLKLNNQETSVSLDVSSLNAGIYFYSIKEEGKYSPAQKLVVTR